MLKKLTVVLLSLTSALSACGDKASSDLSGTSEYSPDQIKFEAVDAWGPTNGINVNIDGSTLKYVSHSTMADTEAVANLLNIFVEQRKANRQKVFLDLQKLYKAENLSNLRDAIIVDPSSVFGSLEDKSVITLAATDFEVSSESSYRGYYTERSTTVKIKGYAFKGLDASYQKILLEMLHKAKEEGKYMYLLTGIETLTAIPRAISVSNEEIKLSEYSDFR